MSTRAIVGPDQATADNLAFVLPMYAGSAPIVLARDHNIALAYDPAIDSLVFVDQRTLGLPPYPHPPTPVPRSSVHSVAFSECGGGVVAGAQDGKEAKPEKAASITVQQWTWQKDPTSECGRFIDISFAAMCCKLGKGDNQVYRVANPADPAVYSAWWTQIPVERCDETSDEDDDAESGESDKDDEEEEDDDAVATGRGEGKGDDDDDEGAEDAAAEEAAGSEEDEGDEED